METKVNKKNIKHVIFDHSRIPLCGFPEWYNLLLNYMTERSIDIQQLLKLHYHKNDIDFLKVKQQFMIKILQENNQYYDIEKYKDVYKANEVVINLWKTNPSGSDTQAWTNAAANVTDAAAHAATDAAYAATHAANAASAAYAANAAAHAAAYAAAKAAAKAAYAAKWKQMYEQLIEIVKAV